MGFGSWGGSCVAMITPWALDGVEWLQEFRSVWKGFYQIPPWPCKHGNPLESFPKDGDTQFCFPKGLQEGIGGSGAAPSSMGREILAAQGGAGAQLRFGGGDQSGAEIRNQFSF